MNVREELLTTLGDLGFDRGGIEDSTRLRQDLGIDSTELVEIGVAIERRLRRRVDSGELCCLETFGQMVATVEQSLTGTAG
jgi:acyl carrier protein